MPGGATPALVFSRRILLVSDRAARSPGPPLQIPRSSDGRSRLASGRAVVMWVQLSSNIPGPPFQIPRSSDAGAHLVRRRAVGSGTAQRCRGAFSVAASGRSSDYQAKLGGGSSAGRSGPWARPFLSFPPVHRLGRIPIFQPGRSLRAVLPPPGENPSFLRFRALSGRFPTFSMPVPPLSRAGFRP